MIVEPIFKVKNDDNEVISIYVDDIYPGGVIVTVTDMGGDISAMYLEDKQLDDLIDSLVEYRNEIKGD
jgi:hypothetical protein